MNRHYNLPPRQRRLQGQVDQCNVGAHLWRELKLKRHASRQLRVRHSQERLNALALPDFAKVRPPVDCIRQWVTS